MNEPRPEDAPPDGAGRVATSDRLYTAFELEEYARRRDQPDDVGTDDVGTVDLGTDDVASGAGRHADPLGVPWPPPPPAPASVSASPASASPASASPAPSVPPAVDDVATDTSVVPAVAEAKRFMTATDFLDRRAGEQELGPATWGWRGRARRWSGGLVDPAMSAQEKAYERRRSAIQRDFEGPRTIVFINPKGGAAKTTGVLAAGCTFGTVRGGGVVAWDNNETRGTLGIRGTRGAHRNTTRELLEDLGRFKDVYQSRIGDLGAFVRSQGDAHFDVLASDERPHVTGTIRAEDFKEVHRLLERFYRIILVDTNMSETDAMCN